MLWRDTALTLVLQEVFHMQIRHVLALPLVANVCGQLLREVEHSDEHGWSLAHVLMNPRAWSRLHTHRRMDEVYIITRGTGNLVIGGDWQHGEHGDVIRVQPGDVVFVPRDTEHAFTNTGMAGLEHLVIVMPPFDPSDVEVLSGEETYTDVTPRVLPQPEPEECFDGAKILSYSFEGCPSIAFGWVSGESAGRKDPHYHCETTEWVYVVEGAGMLEINGISHPVRRGDWVRINPGTRHAFRNEKERHMVVVCICSPQFHMDDAHFD